MRIKKALAAILMAHMVMTASVSAGASLFDNLYGSQGLFGGGLTVPISGIGGIKVQCDPPELKFGDFDFCKIATDITSKYNNLRSKMDYSSPFLSCSIGITELNSYRSCKNKLLGAICGGGAVDRMALQAIRMGFGSIVKPTKSKVAIFGDKGLFGKNLCANDSKRIKKFETSAMKSVYGAGSSTASSKILYDKKVGGSPLMLNTREAAIYLKCAEAANEAGISDEKCNPNEAIDAPDKKQSDGGSGSQYFIANILGSPSGVEEGTDYAAGDLAPYNNRQPSGSKKQLALDYYPMFNHWAKKKGCDTLWLMATASVEGGFKGGRTNLNFVFNKKTRTFDKTKPAKCHTKGMKGVRSKDQGFMQINNCWHQKAVETLMGTGKYPQAIMNAQRGIEYGAKVLGNCWKNRSDIESKVTCYNGLKQKGSKYYKLVKTEYAWLKDMDFGDTIPFVSGVQSDMESSTFDTMAEMATMHSTTLTHSGDNIISRIMNAQKEQMTEAVTKDTARQALLVSSTKKAGDIKKSLNKTTQIQYSNGSDQTKSGLGLGYVPAISKFLNIPFF